jgi:hypothetical protein
MPTSPPRPIFVLPPNDLAKLTAILALLASDNPSEVQAAAAAAQRFLSARGLDFAMLLRAIQQQQDTAPPRPPPPPPPLRRGPRPWRLVLEELVATRSDNLNEWESDFCTSLHRFGRMSEKQDTKRDRSRASRVSRSKR